MSATARVAALVLAAAALGSCKGSIGLEEGRAYPCGASTSECPDGWRCGLDGRCHSSDPGPYVCDRAHVNADCEAGWLCGLDGRCHAPDVASDYTCKVDGDCVGGWRCGPEGRCVDATQDALGATGAALALTGEGVSPKLLTHMPELYAASSFLDTQLVAFVDAGKLTVMLKPGNRNRLDELVTVSLEGRQATQLVATYNWVVVAHTQGVSIYEWDNSLRALKAPVHLAGLRPERMVGQGGAVVHLLIGGRLVVLDASTKAVTFDHPLPVDGGTVDIRDKVITLLATRAGLWAAKEKKGGIGGWVGADGGAAPDPNWVPLSTKELSNQQCDGGTNGLYVSRLLPGSEVLTNRGKFFGEVSGPDGGVVALTQLEEFGPSTGGACAMSPLTLLSSLLCAPCPAGSQYRDFMVSQVEDNGQQDRIEVRCAAASGREDTYRLRMDFRQDGGTECRFDTASDSQLASESLGVMSDVGRYAPATGGLGAMFGAHGQVWFLSKATEKSVSVESDRPLAALTLCADAEFGLSLSDRTFRMLGVRPGTGFAAEGDFSTQAGDTLPQGAVEGKLCWLVGSQSNTVFVGKLNATSGGLQVIASTGPSTQTLPPFHAGTAGLPDGGEALLVGVGDALLAAEVGETTSKLETRVSPSARSPILGFSTFPASSLRSDDGLIAGYILSESGLASFKAVSMQRWRSEPLALPDGTWLRTWTQGRAGRVGYSDGRVISLPSRVEIAPSVPGGRAFDFAQVCGHTFALTSSGLVQLVSSAAGPVGMWIPLTGAPALAADGLTDARGVAPRLFVAGTRLYAMGAHGQAIRYQVACP